MHARAGRTLVGQVSIALLVLAAGAVVVGCNGEATSKPKLFLSLPEYCNTPDGLTLDDKTNVVYLCCPNFNEKAGGEQEKYAGLVMKIDPSNELSIFSPLPLHPDTGKVGPMGLDIGPDGNLYVADNQYFWSKEYKSRLLRVKVSGGKAVGADVAVDGFKLANAVIWRDDAVYVSDTFFDIEDKPGTSGVFRIEMSEIAKGTVHLKPGLDDPHLIATFTTIPNHRKDVGGADGLTFDGDGNLYCGNFGDGVISKITFDKDGEVASKKILVKDKDFPCADGMFWDKKSNTIFVTDSEKNAVRVVTPDGKLSTLWINGDTDGSDGLLDQPCEVVVRGDELLIVCFDMPFPGLTNSAYDKHHTISVIKLKR